MKQINTVLLFLAILVLKTNAQVGINISNPIGVFHIDSKGNTDVSTNAGDEDDVVVLSDGKVGIGTMSPQSSLEVSGSLRIADGTQKANLVLTSDDAGYAHWGYASNISVVEGNIRAGGLANIPVDDYDIPNLFRYTGASISLPAGNWMVYFYSVYNNNTPHATSTLWWDLSDSPTVKTFYGRVLSYTTAGTALVVTYASYSVVNSVPKTYYIWGLSLAHTSYAEFTYKEGARIWATPVY